MHILLIHQVFVRPQDPGGTRHFEFAHELTRQGHRVTVLAGTRSYLTGERLAAPRRERLAEGLLVIRCAVLGGKHRSLAWRTLGFLSFLLSSFLAGLRVGRPDVVWGTSPPLFQAVTAWALARLKRIPWLFEVRDLWPAFAIQLGVLRGRLIIGLAQAAERFLYRQADRIVVNSPGFIDPVVRAGGERGALRMVPNGVDARAFAAAEWPTDWRAGHGLEGKFVALYAGAHGLANGLMVILRAAEMLRDAPRIAFVLVGDGAEKPALQDRAARQRLTNVLFLPPVQKAQMPALLKGADCGIAVLEPIPLFATTYPNKVFDYMAAAKPVVLGIEGPIRELVQGAQAGICFGPGDAEGLAQAIRDLAEQPPLAAEMGARGRTLVEARFDRAEIAKQMIQVLAELAER